MHRFSYKNCASMKPINPVFNAEEKGYRINHILQNFKFIISFIMVN
jgi:hypothetical protein